MSNFVDIDDVKPECISIKSPKKYDEMYLGKISYNNDKCFIRIPSCKLVKIKTISPNNAFLYIKINKQQIESMLSIEDYIVSKAQENTNTWFQSKVKPVLFEEYYHSSVTLHKEFGKVLKCRLDDTSILENIDNNILQQGKHDIVLKLHAVRFHTRSFNLVWRLHSLSPCSKFSFIDDDNEVDYDSDSDSIAIHLEDMTEMKCFLKDSLIDIEMRYQETLDDVKSKLQQIDEFKIKLDNISSLKELDFISKVISEWEM